MKLTITKIFAVGVLSLSLQGCGGLSDETKLEIQMYGVARAPGAATGDRDPQFQTYEVQSITMQSPEGDVVLQADPQSFKIVDRPQIILDRVSEDLKGKTFGGLSIVFASLVEGGDKEESNLSFTLSSTGLGLTEAIVIEKGKTTTFRVKANWANTISAGVMTEPSFEITAN